MPAFVSINFREELLSILDEKGVNQKELAELLGVSRSYVTKFLKGDVKDKELLLDKIAEKLEVEPVRTIRLKIYAGIVPKDLIDLLGANERLLEFYSKLSRSKLPEKEKRNLEEDINAVTNVLLRVLDKEKQRDLATV